MKRIIYLMVLTGAISACQSGKESKEPGSITVDSVSFKKEAEYITKSHNLISTVSIVYPKLKGGMIQ